MYIVYRTLGTTRKSIAVAPPVGVTIRSTTVAEGCTKPTSTARSKRSRTCTTSRETHHKVTRLRFLDVFVCYTCLWHYDYGLKTPKVPQYTPCNLL